MRRFVFILFLLTACSQKPVSHYDQKYSEVKHEIPVEMEFGFVIDNNKYNFTRVATQQGDTVCDYFFGYKNEVLMYQFSTFQDKSLIKLFEEKAALNKKTRRILKRIAEINDLGKNGTEIAKSSCFSLSKERIDSISYAIVLSPALVLVMPIVLPQMLQNEFQEYEILKKVKSVSFNESQADVESKLGVANRVSSKENYKILSYSWSAQPPIYANYFFEEEKLVGYVVGQDSRPQTIIEQSK